MMNLLGRSVIYLELLLPIHPITKSFISQIFERVFEILSMQYIYYSGKIKLFFLFRESQYSMRMDWYMYSDFSYCPFLLLLLATPFLLLATPFDIPPFFHIIPAKFGNFSILFLDFCFGNSQKNWIHF